MVGFLLISCDTGAIVYYYLSLYVSEQLGAHFE
jgi:hypothetical protein